MAKEKMVYHQRQVRIFSEGIRKQTVRDIETGKCTVTQAYRELGVCEATIYKWINKYSRYLIKNRKMVVEDQSEAYRSKELELRIKELEAALGRKQMEIDILNKVIDLADQEYKTDLKKNSQKKSSKSSGSNEKGMATE
jgi:transposase